MLSALYSNNNNNNNNNNNRFVQRCQVVTSEALAEGGVYQCISLCAREKRCDFSLDLKIPSELLPVTVCGREFQVAGAEQRNARLANAVLANGSDLSLIHI